MLIGFSILSIALLLAVLMLVKLPSIKTNSFPIDNPVVLPPNTTSNFYNFTFEPLDKKNHHVEIVVSPYPHYYSPMWVDFWVVNASKGLGILTSFLSFGIIFQPEYPDEYPFTAIMAYAKGINITRQTRFKLWNLTSNVTYSLLLMNFWEDITQNVSVSFEEIYEGESRPLLEFNIMSTTITVTVFIVGTYVVVTSRKQKAKRAKRYAP